MLSESLFLLIFMVAIFVLVLALAVPAMSQNSLSRKKVKLRLSTLVAENHSEVRKLIRERKLQKMGSFARLLETTPMLASLRQLIEHTGGDTTVASVVGKALLFTFGLGILAFVTTSNMYVSVALCFVGFAAPFFLLVRARSKRLERFELDLPDAIDVMKRAIQAGYPFLESLKVVADEMDGPVAQEFGITFTDVNYGAPLNGAMLAMLERVPSTALLALSTSILVQKESGGNLTEILDQTSTIIRSRVKFQRRVRTLSAEGRLSAWILSLTPFILVLVLQVSSPGYIDVLLEHEMGFTIVGYALLGMLIGVLWMRHIIRIRV